MKLKEDIHLTDKDGRNLMFYDPITKKSAPRLLAKAGTPCELIREINKEKVRIKIKVLSGQVLAGNVPREVVDFEEHEQGESNK